MKRKRLLCVCIVLSLLLAVPAYAEEAPAPEDPVISEEEVTVPEEIPDADVPLAEPDTPEVPDIEVPPAGEEFPDTEEPPADVPDGEPTGDVPGEEDPSDSEEAPAEEEPSEQADNEPETLHVVLPSNAWVVVNPYGLEVNRDGVSSRDQIVSAAMPIVNYSSVPVAVIASVTGYTTPGSNVTFVPAPPRSDTWAKELFLFAEFQPALDGYGGAFWSGEYTGASNQLVVTAGGSPAAQVLELAAGDVVPGCGAFRLFGGAAVSPENPWCAEDAIQVMFAFTFVPLA